MSFFKSKKLTTIEYLSSKQLLPTRCVHTERFDNGKGGRLIRVLKLGAASLLNSSFSAESKVRAPTVSNCFLPKITTFETFSRDPFARRLLDMMIDFETPQKHPKTIPRPREIQYIHIYVYIFIFIYFCLYIYLHDCLYI